MKIYKILIPISVLLLLFNAHKAQKPYTNIDNVVADLNKISFKIISNIPDKEKYEENEKFKEGLRALLENKSSFEHKFDFLKNISILKKNQLKIYNWAIPLSDGSYNYFAYIQVKNSKNQCIIHELFDKSSDITLPETKVLTKNSWYGALYYEIVNTKKQGKNYYTLLGWDGNNVLTNKKIIEIIKVDSDGERIMFGAPLFKSKKGTKKRVVFEYSDNAVMSLKYHSNLNKIVFDFLVPTSSNLDGIYEYYGPSLNRFDAYTLNKGKWIYEKDIDIELDRTIKDFLWKDPKE